MKGLLIKDWKLLKNQKQFFFVIGVIVLVFMISSANPFFAISYATIMFSMFTISTISYDDFEKGMSYLFTLPVSRKEYVLEKFVFGGLCSICVGMVSTVIALIVSQVKGGSLSVEELLSTGLGTFIVVVVFLALTIPVQLKFGGDKGRMAMMAIVLAVIAAVFGVTAIVKATGGNIDSILNYLSKASDIQIVCVLIVVGVIAIIASMIVSIRILKKREF